MELSADKASRIYSQHDMFDIGVSMGYLNVFHGGYEEMGGIGSVRIGGHAIFDITAGPCSHDLGAGIV